MRILLGFFAFFALFLFAGEVVTRLSLPLLRSSSPAYYYRQYIESLVELDSRLVWRGRAHASAKLANTEGELIGYDLNEEGWRSGGASVDALVLGDSFSFGTGVAAGDRYFEKLGLNFLAAAQMGYSVDQYYLLARQLLAKQTWKILVLQLSNNDLTDVDGHGWLCGGAPCEVGALPEAIISSTNQFSSVSELANLLSYLKLLITKGGRSEDNLRESLKRYGLALEETLRIAADLKIPVVILMATDWGGNVYGPSVASAYEQLVTELANRYHVSFIQAGDPLEVGDLLPYPDLHWNRGAHGKVGKLLELAMADFFPSAGSPLPIRAPLPVKGQRLRAH